MAGESWQQRYVTANGIRVHYVEQGDGFPVVMLHGFPELWYSWRHQVPALAAAGLRAIAPDLRGYGETDKPAGLETYDMEHLVGDLVGLLDALQIEKAVIVGHDWGGVVVWSAALMAPERVERVVGVNTPLLPRSAIPPIQAIKQSGDNRMQYMVFFQEPGRAEAFFAQDLEGTLRRFYAGAGGGTEYLSDEEFQVYVEAFRKGGLTGPLNFYRNIDRNWEQAAALEGRQVLCPALMVMAEKDPVLRPELTAGMEARAPNLRKELIRDCGHWTQQEKPQELNRLLVEFLGSLGRS
ncbi:MAG: alpha/beta hydrolase [Chloroflexi bacterium]|nr:alpha/beta hydrolase [Chloroflexota bacterium]